MDYFDRENLDSVKLIQTSICSIIFGWYKDEYQELFRCPRELDDTDLVSFIDDNRYFLGFTCDTQTENLREIPNKEFIGYYRMYFRGGSWHGRWFSADENNNDLVLTDKDKIGINHIIKYFSIQYPKGCDWFMQDDMKETYEEWGCEKRYLLTPIMSTRYKVLIDTTYGNGDYPIRIYVYRPKK